MRARVPQDVDLEDKLLYGLSPLRFGYLVIAAITVLGLWRIEVVPAGVRVVPCLMLSIAAALLAWGRWRGRSIDGWLVDLLVFVRRNCYLGVPWRPPRRRWRSVVPFRAINALRAHGTEAHLLGPTPPPA